MNQVLAGMLGNVPSMYPFSLDFEAGVTGWVADSGVTFVQSSTQAYAGTYSGRISNTAGAYYGAEYPLPEAIERAGKTITVSGRFWADTGTINNGLFLLQSDNTGLGMISSPNSTTHYAAEMATRTTYVGFTSVTSGVVARDEWGRFVLTITPTDINAKFYRASGALAAEVTRATTTAMTFTHLFIRQDQNAYTYVDNILIELS